MKLLLALWLLFAFATPADAAPVAVAVSALGKAIGAFAAKSFLARFVVNIALSAGLSVLARALTPTAKREQPGIRTQTTTTGGTVPQKFILGRYATEGHLLAPPASFGDVGSTPLAYLVYVVALSVLPRCSLLRVIVNDEYLTLSGAAGTWGRAATGKFSGVQVDFRDGTQGTAHPGLMETVAFGGPRPWAADMVGVGLCYAVCRFEYSREVFNGLPSVRFEMLGAPLYDPRFDSTVGGSGAQRWNNPATWAQTENPAVMIYNILRGITLADGAVWGGECATEDLPLSNWMAAMNECDAPVVTGTGTEPQYRAGLEIAISDEPAAVINALLKSCSGQIAEVGGVYTIAVGAPALPVYFLTDDSIIVTRERHLDPFPGLTDTYNGITASYPEPASLWEPREAPPVHDTTLEAADGGRRLVADVQFTACSYVTQVRRMMDAYIADERRHRRHMISLPPSAAILSPLDTVSWTSAENGYTGKLFEVTGLNDGLMSVIQTVQLRERDPADFDPLDYVPESTVGLGPVLPAPQAVPGWNVFAGSVIDATGTARRPKLTLLWTASGPADARGVEWEVYLGTSGILITSGNTLPMTAGRQDITAGILPSQTYAVRGRLLVDRATEWTPWVLVTTPAGELQTVDLAPASVSTIRSAYASTPAWIHPNSGWVTLAAVGFAPATGDGFIMAFAEGVTSAFAGPDSGGAYARIRMLWRGSPIGFEKSGAGVAAPQFNITASAFAESSFFSFAGAGWGWGVLELQLRNAAPAVSPNGFNYTDTYIGGSMTLAVVEYKR